MYITCHKRSIFLPLRVYQRRSGIQTHKPLERNVFGQIEPLIQAGRVEDFATLIASRARGGKLYLRPFLIIIFNYMNASSAHNRLFLHLRIQAMQRDIDACHIKYAESLDDEKFHD